MIKVLKRLTILMVILSIICCVAGFFFSGLAEENRGVKYYGITTGGVPSINYNEPEGMFGGNSEKEKTSETISVIAFVLSGVFMLSAIVSGVKAYKKSTAR